MFWDYGTIESWYCLSFVLTQLSQADGFKTLDHPCPAFRMLILQVAIRTLATTRRKTTVAEPTSREAMDMPADVAEDIGFISLLLFC